MESLDELPDLFNSEQRILVSLGADVNVCDEEGNTPLIRSSTRGHVHCVSALIATGADVNMMNSEHVTALIATAKYGHRQCAIKLIKAGAGCEHCLKVLIARL